jgi:hypothetical protein
VVAAPWSGPASADAGAESADVRIAIHRINVRDAVRIVSPIAATSGGTAAVAATATGGIAPLSLPLAGLLVVTALHTVAAAPAKPIRPRAR